MTGKGCDYCGKEVPLPFKCHLCGGTFCPDHRLPESHSCSGLWRARTPRREAPSDLRAEAPWSRREVDYGISIPKRVSIPTELKHLLVSVILVTGVGMSLVSRYIFTVGSLTVLLLGVAFAFSFLIHELSHKLLAQRSGFWAEFRLSLVGALLTLISIVSPIKFISPGAVLVAGYPDPRVGGRLSLAGPLANMAIAAALSLPLYLTPWPLPIRLIIRFTALFNAYIALFNLIPFGSLDGLKVFIWSKVIWASAFIASIALTALLYLHP